MSDKLAISSDPFDPTRELQEFGEQHPAAGGIVSFLGQVRRERTVVALELQHYEPMTLPAIVDLAQDARMRWDIAGLFVLHRVGMLEPGEPIVLVACAGRHRRDAFEAVDFIMDHLKSASWFWKREKSEAGWHWIEPRHEDHSDILRWKHPRLLSPKVAEDPSPYAPFAM